jgi:hypothetical protein
VLSTTDAADAAFTLPVGIQAGDLIVVLDIALGTITPPTTAIPSGLRRR